MSPYLNRELVEAERSQLEAHLFACQACHDELEAYRGMLGSLRILPSPAPPTDLVSRVMAGYRQALAAESGQQSALNPLLASDDPSRDRPLPEAASRVASFPTTHVTAPPTGFSTSAQGTQQAGRPGSLPHGSGASQPPLEVGTGASPWASSAPTPHRSFALVAAVLFAVFVGAFFSGRQGQAGSDLARLAPEQVVKALLPVAVNVSGGTQGRPGQWNEATLALQAQSPSQAPLDSAEVAWQVPPEMQINLGSAASNATDDDEPLAGIAQPLVAEVHSHPNHVVLQPCCMGPDGRSEQRVRWRVQRSGRFPSYVEVRCQGVYRRSPVEFVALP